MDQRSDEKTGTEGWRQGQSLRKSTPAHSPGSNHGRNHTAWPWKPQLQGGGTYLTSPHLSGTEGLVSIRPLGPTSSPSVLVILLGLSLPRYRWGRLSQILPSSWAAWWCFSRGPDGRGSSTHPTDVDWAPPGLRASSELLLSHCQPCPTSAQRHRPLGARGRSIPGCGSLPSHRGLSSY